jgi:hypothetical protein
MGYLDNTEITIDAILTKKGRQKLAQGQSLNISKFALGDDEIDYGLYDPAHPRGSAFYDNAILNTPILEASSDETQVLRYKLVTLPKGTTKIPIVSFGISAIRTAIGSGGTALSPTTNTGGNRNAGYTLILADSRAGTLTVTSGATQAATVPAFLGEEVSRNAQVVSGLEFVFTPNPNLTSTIQTTITAFGNGTGGFTTIPVQVLFQP